MVDTRNANGPLGGPAIAGTTTRTFPLQQAWQCIPPAAQSAQAYFLNVTLVPVNGQPVGFITVFPTGQSQPLASTMNDLEGWALANGGIFRAGTSGSIDIYTTNNTHVVIDITGYFAAPGSPPNVGNTLTTINPCRVTADSDLPPLPPNPNPPIFDVPGDCVGPGLAVAAIAANFVLTPSQPIGYLTVWPAGQQQPLASLLNTHDLEVAGNGSILPAGSTGANQATGFSAFIDIGKGTLRTDVTGYFVNGGSGSGGTAVSMAPAKLEINLGAVPLDLYSSSDVHGGLVPNCPAAYTVRNCIKVAFNNSPWISPYSPNNYVAQGVTGVRFFFSLGGGGGSTVFATDGTVRPAWLTNLQLFFNDLHDYGIQRISPTAVLLGDWSGSNSTNPALCPTCFPLTQQTVASCGGQLKSLLFYPWLPYGLEPGTRYPDGQGQNDAYYCAAANPIFWTWDPYFNMVDVVLAAAAANTAQLYVADFDIDNEINLTQFTVQARVIYDNMHGGTHVLDGIRQRMASKTFLGSRVTVSVPLIRTNLAGYTCSSASVFGGDAASLLHASTLLAAITGGPLGQPSGATLAYGLLCGGSTTQMINLPASYDPPSLINVHNHMCLEGTGAGSGTGCNVNQDVTSTALTLYSDVNAFLQHHALSTNPDRWIVFGETTTNQNCDGYTQAMARQSGSAFVASTLFQQHGARTVLRPWNYLTGVCFLTPSKLIDAYRP